MAVDQNARVLKEGNDLSTMDIFDELNEYSNDYSARRHLSNYGQNSANFDVSNSIFHKNNNNKTIHFFTFLQKTGVFLMSNIQASVPGMFSLHVI